MLPNEESSIGPHMNRSHLKEPEFRRSTTNLMSASYHASADSTPVKNKLESSRKENHRSCHTLPRKIKRDEALRPFRPIALDYDSFTASSTTSIVTLTDDYELTSERHPNYMKMMNDNHLIDSCSAAEQEIREPRTSTTPSSVYIQPQYINRLSGRRTRSNSVQSSVMSVTETFHNIQKLQQWISYMQRYVEAVSPSLPEVLRMTSFERKTRLKEQVDLRKYVASYDSLVKKLVKSATCASPNRAGNNVKSLEQSYLNLLLQAIEAQCLLEGYPGMRNKSGDSASSNDNSFDDEAAAALGPRIVEGQSSSPVNTVGYYCLHDTSVDDRYSKGSIDSVDGAAQQNSTISGITRMNIANISGQSMPESQSETMVCPSERLYVDTVHSVEIISKESQSGWSTKKVNRWLDFQPTTHKQNDDALSTTSNLSSHNTAADSGRLSITSISSYEHEQQWDNYQELYSNIGSSTFDLPTDAEYLLNFGEDYSEQLRPSGPSTASFSEIFHDDSNANNSPLDESFLLSGFKKSLPTSALKTIDDIFDFSDLQISTSGRALEWIEPGLSPRRSPSGTSCSKSTKSSTTNSTTSNLRTNSNLNTSSRCLYFSPIEHEPTLTWTLDDTDITIPSMSLESFANDLNDITIVPNSNYTIDSIHGSKEILTFPTKCVLEKNQSHSVSTRIFLRARRRYPFPSTPIRSIIPSNGNIRSLRLEDVRRILDVCHSSPQCLTNVLLGQTISTIVHRAAVDLAQCLRTCDQCHCGTIAQFVQTIVNFLLRYSNFIGHITLYTFLAKTLRDLFYLAQTVGEGVAKQRKSFKSIEFML